MLMTKSLGSQETIFLQKSWAVLERNQLTSSLTSIMSMNRCGFGLLMYGFGSKKALIEDFASTELIECGVVVINGYLHSINLKQVR
ncbi:hypothetical protein ACSBR1_020359 [Camellia fascicularis]